jgi:arylsulfatase A-like enzyme
VAITSDHGEEFGEHGGSSHGKTLYEEVLNVPFIIRFPDEAVHGPTGVPVSGVDIGPTLLEAAGVAKPEGFAPYGVSALPADPDRPIVSVSGLRRLPRDARSRQRAVRRGAWKLLVNDTFRSAALYDLASDPLEQVNLVDRRPDIAAHLAADLRQLAP